MKKIALQLSILVLLVMIALELSKWYQGSQNSSSIHDTVNEGIDSLVLIERGLHETISKRIADPFLFIEQSRTNRKYLLQITQAARNNEGYIVHIESDFKQTLRLIDELESYSYHNLKGYRMSTSGNELLTQLEFHY